MSNDELTRLRDEVEAALVARESAIRAMAAERDPAVAISFALDALENDNTALTGFSKILTVATNKLKGKEAR